MCSTQLIISCLSDNINSISLWKIIEWEMCLISQVAKGLFLFCLLLQLSEYGKSLLGETAATRCPGSRRGRVITVMKEVQPTQGGAFDLQKMSNNWKSCWMFSRQVVCASKVLLPPYQLWEPSLGFQRRNEGKVLQNGPLTARTRKEIHTETLRPQPVSQVRCLRLILELLHCAETSKGDTVILLT